MQCMLLISMLASAGDTVHVGAPSCRLCTIRFTQLQEDSNCRHNDDVR